MRWYRQSDVVYLKQRAAEHIRDGEYLKAIKCLIVVLEKTADESSSNKTE